MSVEGGGSSVPRRSRKAGRASALDERRRRDPATDGADLLRLRLTLVLSQYRAY
jgi:hypothetical protein